MLQTNQMPGTAVLPLRAACAPATLEAAGEQWLADRRAQVKASTYIKYESVWRLHIRPALGPCLLAAFDTPTADAFRQAMLEQGFAPKTVRDTLVVLRSVLAYAARSGHPELATVRLRYPREPRKPTRVLTRAEQSRFVAYLHHDMDDCKFGVLLALSTGIRLGELCALRWGNISLQERSITIGATMQRLPVLGGAAQSKTQVVITSPKTDAGARVIPMSNTVLKLCRSIGKHAPTCYVLTGTDQYMEPRTLQARMQGYTRACGLDGVHFHTLRHTFATRSVEVGFEIKSLSEILGHANTSITLDRYVHASMELKRSNMNKLASVGL